MIEDYNREQSFSNFFPGIAGKFGIPMWVYYVSRAQGVCSMGVRDKNHPIMEFLFSILQRMIVSSSELEILEENRNLGIDGGNFYLSFNKDSGVGANQDYEKLLSELLLYF